MDEKLTTPRLIAAIQSDDANVRTRAWLRAGEAGADALKPLAQAMAKGPLEVSRAAQRAMWRITHDAGAPGAPGGSEREATAAALLELLKEDQPAIVRREVLWMVSELADSPQATKPIAALLTHKDLGEDARMVLERLPGDESTRALQAAFRAAPEQAKFALAHSLRRRGVQVDGYQSQKLTPARERG
jgi:hypothetical protein